MLKEVATRIEPADITMLHKIITLLGPYLSDICPKIGAANPLTSHPKAAAKLIVETLTSQSVAQTLSEIDYHGLIGRVQFDSDGKWIMPQLKVYKWDNSTKSLP